MKKILPIITLFLFLEVFSFLVPNETLAVTQKEPTCRRGYGTIRLLVQSGNCGQGHLCCKTVGTVLGSLCLNINSSNNDPINKCDELSGNADLVARNVCTDILYKYNPATEKCEKYIESLWVLKNTCGGGTVGIQTGIGCIPTGNLTDFLKFVLVYAFVASGGIILLLIISTGYTLITSSGNPEKLQGAQENIVALFSGLALIAFSLVLLQTIGADILNLKAFMPIP
jgi:hypothetical protein